jgi:hypothetical protein
MMRRLRQVGAVLVGLAVLAGPPAVAVWWWRRSEWDWPSLADAQRWVGEPMSSVALGFGIAAFAAALWLVIVLTIMAVARRHVRAVWLRVKRMPVPSPAQATATSLASVAVFGVPGGALSASAAAIVPVVPETPQSTAVHNPAADTSLAQPAGLDRGVSLPDRSWLPTETARAIVLVAAVGWLRRRRDRPVDGTPQEGPDRPASPRAAPQPTPDPMGKTGDGVPVLGQRIEGPVLVTELPRGGVALTGAGAADAARGILVTATSGHGLSQIVTTRGDVERLVGPHAATIADNIPGLHLANDVDGVLRTLDAIRHLSTAVGEHPSGPATIVLAHAAHLGTDAASQLRTALATTSSVTAVIVDGRGFGASRVIDANGFVRSADSGAVERWCVLSRATAGDLLLLAAQAVGTTSPPVTPAEPERPPTPTDSPTGPGDEPCRPTLTLFGDPTVTYRGIPVTLQRSAALQAFVFLAVHRNGTTSRELSRAMWPGDPQPSVSARTYTAISELRRSMTKLTGHPIVRRSYERYQIDPAQIEVDLWQLHDAIGEAQLGFAQRTAILHRIIDLYTGELAAGKPWPWLNPYREEIRKRVTDAYLALAETAEQSDTLALLIKAAKANLFSEAFLRQVVEIFAETE